MRKGATEQNVGVVIAKKPEEHALLEIIASGNCQSNQRGVTAHDKWPLRFQVLDDCLISPREILQI